MRRDALAAWYAANPPRDCTRPVTHVKPVRVRAERVPFPLVSVKTESWGAIRSMAARDE